MLIHHNNSKNINKGQLILQEEERLVHYNLNSKNINKSQNLDHENDDHVEEVNDPHRDDHADDVKIDDDILNHQNNILILLLDPNHHIPLSQKLIPLIYQINQPWKFEVEVSLHLDLVHLVLRKFRNSQINFQ